MASPKKKPPKSDASVHDAAGKHPVREESQPGRGLFWLLRVGPLRIIRGLLWVIRSSVGLAAVVAAITAVGVLWAADWLAVFGKDRVEAVVVEITLTQQRADWYSPWQPQPPKSPGGSGFIIGEGQILTNAHVVSDARQVLVRNHNTSTPVLATVEHIAHDSDLALLRVDSEQFAVGVKPLRFGGLPSLRSRVRTYGFPVGGKRISRTEGVVSRVQFWQYVHSGSDAHLAVQTDSAINPGNSGGPVVQNGRVVGVAFQSSRSLNDVGFFIPTPVVKRFLRDVEDGNYDGYTELGALTTPLRNTAKRGFLGLAKEQSGVVVNHVLQGTSAEGQLNSGDVILEIEGHKVENDGTIVYGGHRVALEQMAEEKLSGEELSLKVLRDGTPLDVSITMQPWVRAPFKRHRYDSPPHYLIFAGLVFMQLERELFNASNAADAPHLLYAHAYQSLEEPQLSTADKPPIVLTRILPHAINIPYRNFAGRIVRQINGQPIRSLKDVSDALDAASSAIQLLLDPGDILLVFNRDEADKAHLGILRSYNITQDRRF